MNDNVSRAPAPESKAPKDRITIEETASVTTHRVLIVEDEFLIRLTLAEALTDEGFACLEAESGDAALRLIESGETFDLLLTDVQLPGKLDGPALVRAARARKPDLPVIFMTGRPDPAASAGQRGIDLTISKPYLPSEICAAARRMLTVSGG